MSQFIAAIIAITAAIGMLLPLLLLLLEVKASVRA